ncbi:ABC transporter substrate-binding protein [Rhizobium sp. 1AS11]|uniref:ABC transporter substrate-binding protein n=1 Tax=Rhizobium acaciae TaxID=2989736 RepID=UPI00027D6E8E|nr:ABC transporter substrate-binding protein [Rhizobium acaciae]EJC66836.1 ABC-type branched-chain amino acid transport system, periplasmic component [Rhizobium leguminosarum bv. viciae WSM1455]MCW1407208.1 ABC transporter substrate-binding protein [Rhizobium acaciae]MCW1738967.1 ABC transporter substrate-binding protein [Rhizobium acaciae]MCW1748247.1 ABC transporter substrate-binding protein [Rhizobium acaciae]
MKRRYLIAWAAASLITGAALHPQGVRAEDTVSLPCVCELSGAGAVSGKNYRDGAYMAVEEINAGGGILGKKIVMDDYDTQSDAPTSRALVQKAIDADAYAIIGTVYSGSTIVNMLVAKQNGVPQFTGSEAPNITQQGNPYIFRTSSSAAKGVPGLTPYFKDTLKAKKIGVAWVNNEFGKGGHDVFTGEMKKAGIDIVADVPSEQGQADFAADVSKIKESGAEAVFVYLNEEEAARFLKEAKKQGLKVPLVGEVTLTSQKVIDLAGDAADGAYAHVGVTAGADVPAIQAFGEKFKQKYNRATDHNGLKGYVAVYAVKYVSEMNGSLDREALAKKLHGLTLDVAKYPGMLLTTTWDDTGEMSRESFMTQVVDGKQKVVGTVPAN